MSWLPFKFNRAAQSGPQPQFVDMEGFDASRPAHGFDNFLRADVIITPVIAVAEAFNNAAVYTPAITVHEVTTVLAFGLATAALTAWNERRVLKSLPSLQRAVIDRSGKTGVKAEKIPLLFEQAKTFQRSAAGDVMIASFVALSVFTGGPIAAPVLAVCAAFGIRSYASLVRANRVVDGRYTVRDDTTTPLSEEEPHFNDTPRPA